MMVFEVVGDMDCQHTAFEPGVGFIGQHLGLSRRIDGINEMRMVVCSAVEGHVWDLHFGGHASFGDVESALFSSVANYLLD